MKLIGKIILAVLLNAVGLWIASNFIKGVSFTDDLLVAMEVALILTALNFFLRPILKLILTPIIILTLGFGLIAINAFMVYILDILAKDISIQGIAALLYTTLILSALNFVFHLSTKS